MTGSTLISSLLTLACILLPLCAAQGGSCRGRCAESFRRGRHCDCDSDCVLYNTCCPDYHAQCDNTKECIAVCLANHQGPDVLRDGNSALGGIYNLMAPSQAPSLAGGLFAQVIEPLSPSDLSESGPAPVVGPVEAGVPSSGNPLTIPVPVALTISGQGDQISSGPAFGSSRPSSIADIAQAMGANNPAGLDASLNPDLCSGLPIDGLAALFNGSIIVFRGDFFWLVNPKTRTAGPTRRITEELGIPSPIDTAFTRCNCQGKTIIIKGDDYWSFENGVMELGYPRSVSRDFGGLNGEITAALPIPATRKRPEAVYFFKKGGTAQKFSYPSGSGPTCSGKRSKNSFNTKNQHAGQAEIQLSAVININAKWKGFPTPVTSALSMPNPKKSDGFDYLVFSWPKVLNIKISGEALTLAAPASSPSQQKDIRSWLNCP
ncbi:proteoglycan 4-like [Xyrauchen texanus]|uniref:proteoglycan 4-like n=1 Tax=Xyrauchen texanus TaxID=154827 RepID=UPI0022424A46|nr:proteoglycan 4-like [Xyrauchen texanus]XP_051989726.1 proteoglycan 4-like [Xyrauchen texanus]